MKKNTQKRVFLIFTALYIYILFFFYNLVMNYYEAKLKEIKKMINNNDNKNALVLLNEELKMPYIPEKYEAEFILLADELSFKTKNIDKKNLTREEIIDYLFSGEKLKEIRAIENLRNFNIRTFLDEIEKWLFLNNDNKIGQAIIYEILVDQEIDKDILFGDIKINPLKTGHILIDKNVIEAINYIDNSKESPQIQEAALNELQFYLLKTFPKKIDDGKLFAQIIINIIKKLLEGDNNFSEIELKIFNIIKEK